ncbi:MAG TPA: hypothetical protein ACFCUD_10370 [Cyclobacteriaceae bacterium]
MPPSIAPEYPSGGEKCAGTPESYRVADVKSQPKGDRKGRVLWHTQGSGKSLSMVFFTGKIVLALDNPTVVVITTRHAKTGDRNLFETSGNDSKRINS